MRAEGVPETDPEFIKIRNTLAAAKQQSDVQKQRMKYAQQNQQQQQQHLSQRPVQNGVNQQTSTNGFRLATSAPENGASHASPTPSQSQIPSASAATSSEDQPATRSGMPPLSEDQMMLLRNQMIAFKALARDAPISPTLQRSIFPSQRSRSVSTPEQALDAASQALDQHAPQSHSRGSQANATSSIAKHAYEKTKSPHDYLPKYINYNQYSDHRSRYIIPSIMPPGVDIDRMREERENIIYNRMLNRKAELEKLNANMVFWDTSKSDLPVPDTSIKLKALLEYKMLALLPKQRALRQQIGREMLQADNLAMTANRSLYRRQKKQNLREARITERLEKAQRDARETKEKKKHNDHLRAIMEHAEEVKKAAKEQQARIQRLGRLMLAQHQTIEKEEQKRIERVSKQRLQALKSNDEETYMALLKDTKDTRISHLLGQTDGFLKQLADSVKQQQRAAVERWDKNAAVPEDPESEAEGGAAGDEDADKKVDYYEVAHRIKEEVKEQSGNLVGGKLKEYQVKGLQWMISLYNNNLNGILADEMGLGKTIQTISLITYLIEKKRQHGPYLVVVPLSTLTNWNNEFEKWAPTVTRIVYKGAPAVRKQAQGQIRSGNFQVLLTTYDFIIKDRPILSKVKWLHMIVDEGHRMKNAQSKLSQTITTYYTTRFRLILTGTPLQNNLPELWALLNFVLPSIFKSVKSFDDWFNTPFANTGGQETLALSEEEQILVIRRLHKVLRPFLLRRLKKDVEKDLPDKKETVIKCPSSALQRKLYMQLQNHNKLMVADGKGGKTGMRGLSNMLMQLRKVCNHPFVFEPVEDAVNPSRNINDTIWRTAGKFELLDRILPKLKATGHRVLMFFQMTAIMNIMEDFLRLRNISFLRLDGSTKSDERADLLKDFNAENSPYFCFLLSTRAGGLGLNLQTADTVIIYDSDWNPHQDLQAQDRAHRIGQKNEVRILRLISTGTVEEKILERANFKLDMDGKVIQAGKFDNKSTNEERDSMLRLMLETAEPNAEDLETEEMTDEDLNMLMKRHDSEMDVFERLDEERAQDPVYGTESGRPRLFPDDELPDIWLGDDADNEAAVQEAAAGRGARERTRVKYDDGLTEEQWLEAVDNDDDTIEEAMARKQASVQRRVNNKEKKLRKEGMLDSPAPPSVTHESSESPAPQQNRRNAKPGRKSAGNGNGRGAPRPPKRSADDASLDGDATPVSQPKSKRGRAAKVQETLQPEERVFLQNVLDLTFEQLNNLDADWEDGAKRDIIDMFTELPNRAMYPDYYEIIHKPIAMHQVSKKINGQRYQSLDEFADDIRLMCNNCRTYNDDGSMLFGDANLIEVCN